MASARRARWSAWVENTYAYSSGRVIATCRMVLATVFFLALWLDPAQPVRATALGYGLLLGYVLFAAAMLRVAWHEWWLDHCLARAALAADVFAFLAAVFFTERRSSPARWARWAPFLPLPIRLRAA